MVFIFGAGDKSVNLGQLFLPYWCSSCDQISTFAITENYSYAHVYGIRLAKYSSKYFLVCHTCDRVLVIPTREQFIAAQEIGRSTQSWGLDERNLIPLVAETARRVLGQFDYAAQLESSSMTSQNEVQSTWLGEAPLELQMTPAQDSNQIEEIGPKSTPKFCSECGTSFGVEQLRFCSECGTEIDH